MSTQPSTSSQGAGQQPGPSTTIGELRKQYGPHFAKGYGDNDPLGEVLGRAGVATIEEYLAQNQTR
jgi:hypothetical protein